jgi:hypothetical protein
MRDRFARHYADFAALWLHPDGRTAAAQLDLLERVRIHKSRFFASSWAHYATAVPGSLRLDPPDARNAELRRAPNETNFTVGGESILRQPDLEQAESGFIF